MIRTLPLFLVIGLVTHCAFISHAQEKKTFNDIFSVKGYINQMNACSFVSIDSMMTDNLIHNRFDLKAFISDNFSIVGGIRNRLFYGEGISDFCTNSAVGSVKMIQSDLGFHVVELLEKDDYYLPKVATIYKEFKPSEETMSAKDNEANGVLSKLYQKINTMSAQDQIRTYFDSIVQSSGYQAQATKLNDNAPEVPATFFKSQSAGDRLIKVAYKSGSKVGTLVGRPIRDKDTYVIGMVYVSRKKGTPTFDEIKKEIKKDFLTEKKNQIIMKNFSGKSLEDLSGIESVKPAEVSFNNMNSIDAEIIGSLFSSNGPKESQTTKPLQGSTGVYVIVVDKVNNSSAKSSFKVEKEELNKNWIMQVVRNPISYSQNRKPEDSK